MEKVRVCLTKSVILAFLAVAAYLVAFCPCERVGRCHWEGIVLCLVGAGAVLAIENMKFTNGDGSAMGMTPPVLQELTPTNIINQ
jgi:hypothetical protein